jgi:hypothetical protein
VTSGLQSINPNDERLSWAGVRLRFRSDTTALAGRIDPVAELHPDPDGYRLMGRNFLEKVARPLFGE